MNDILSNQTIAPLPVYRVKVNFSKDPVKLAKTLDWLFNTGKFAYFSMQQPQIDELRKITRVDVVE